MATEQRAPRFIDAFTGIRALGALGVLVWHLREVSYVLLPATMYASPFIDAGALGLDAFFVLSGFVIAHNYADRLADLDLHKYRTYMAARFARVYPVHLVTFLGTALLVGYVAHLGGTLNAESNYTVGTFLGNLFMLQGLPGVDAWNVPSWSVSCEFVAYLLFPLVAARLLRLSWPTATILAFTAVIAATAGVFALRDSESVVLAMRWMQITSEFSAGALLWAAWRHRGRPGPWCDAVAVAAFVAILALVGLWALPFYAAIPLVPVLVIAVAGSTGPVRTVMASRALAWLGMRSYSLYLTHSAVIAVAVIWVVPPTEYLDAPLWQKIAILVGIVVVSILVAAVTYSGVEEPARHWLRRRGPQWRGPASIFSARSRREEIDGERVART